MANQHYGIIRNFTYDFGNFNRKTVEHDDTSVASPRVGGKLKLQSNPYSLRHSAEESLVYDRRFKYAGYPLQASTTLWPDMSDARMNSVTNKALARFTGRVRKHNASLGVTLGSIGQTRDMIVDRTQKIASIFEKVEHIHDYDRKVHPDKLARKRRKAIRDRAGDFLEWEFGWMPLVADIQAGLGALSQPFQDRWISGHYSSEYRDELNQVLSTFNRRLTQASTATVTIGANVRVNNPNLFLSNRLGLLNLPGVALDLIPWSFVVNMFSNMGQMVNSITDFVGIDMLDTSTTKTAFTTLEDHLFAGQQPWQEKTFGYSTAKLWEKRKVRTVGGLPQPSFELRLPTLNFELALIAISLILQKSQKINRLMGNSALNFSFPR